MKTLSYIAVITIGFACGWLAHTIDFNKPLPLADAKALALALSPESGAVFPPKCKLKEQDGGWILDREACFDLP